MRLWNKLSFVIFIALFALQKKQMQTICFVKITLIRMNNHAQHTDDRFQLIMQSTFEMSFNVQVRDDKFMYLTNPPLQNSLPTVIN